MTRKPSRLRRWMTWVGVVGCGVVAVVWLGSYGWHPSYQTGVPSSRGDYDPDKLLSPNLDQYTYTCNYVLSDGRLWQGNSTFVVTYPLWFPLVILAIPTAILWYRDRQLPPGYCQSCGYNLTGNVSGICPECGEATA